jgi:hypothetical protein
LLWSWQISTSLKGWRSSLAAVKSNGTSGSSSQSLETLADLIEDYQAWRDSLPPSLTGSEIARSACTTESRRAKQVLCERALVFCRHAEIGPKRTYLG